MVVFRQGVGLPSQEGAHVGDALFLLVPPSAFQLKLLLFLAQVVNLLSKIFNEDFGLATSPHGKIGHTFVSEALFTS